MKQPQGPNSITWQGAWPPEGCPRLPEGEHLHIGNTLSHLVTLHEAYHSGKVLPLTSLAGAEGSAAACLPLLNSE